MDEVTKTAVLLVAAQNPGRAVRLTHQFLDGTDGKPCGFVPNVIAGEPVVVAGQWWRP